MSSIVRQAGQKINMNGTDNEERRPEIESIRVGDLTVDHDYQRGINQKRVKELVATYDPILLGIVIANRRTDGRIVIVDGQHRVEVLKELFGADHPVVALMHNGLSIEVEAYLFYRYNGKRLGVNARAMWHAALMAGDVETLALDQVLTSHGIRVSHESERRSEAGVLNAPASLRDIAQPRMANRGGGLDYQHVDRVLTILLEAWGRGEHNEALQSDVLKGTDAFLRRYGDVIDDKRLVECMQRDGTADIRQRGNTIKTSFRLTSPRAYGMALLGSYNHGRRNRLPEWGSN